MPKMKTNKAAAKRFKITGSGKLLRDRPFHKHLLQCKSANKKRKMLNEAGVSKTDMKRIKSMLPGI